MRRLLFLFILTVVVVASGACVRKGPSSSTTGDAAMQRQAFGEKGVSLSGAADSQSQAERELTEAELPLVADDAPLSLQEQQALESEVDIYFDLDDQERKEVQLHFKRYTHDYRKTFTIWLKRAEQYLPYVRSVFRERGLPEELIYLPFVESGFNARAYSRAGAAGMWQFMPFTGRKFGLPYDWWIDVRRDPYKATHAAADYLSRLHGMFGDWYLALAAYNAGEGKIGRAVRATGTEDFFELAEKSRKLKRRARLMAETRHYVPKFLAMIKIMRNLESLGFEPVNWNAAPDLVELQVKGGTDLLALTKAAGLEWREFHEHNRAFRRYVSPPDRESTIYLPRSYEAKAAKFLARPDSVPYAGYRLYKVRSGDSWHRIGRKYGVPVAVLKKVNKRSSNLIKPGQRIVVPRSGRTLAVASPAEKTRRIARTRANYTVRKGDNLYDLGKRFGVSVRTLQRANGLNSRGFLRVGQRLYVPDQGKTASLESKRQAEQVRKTVYRVRNGDSVWTIARKFGVSHLDLLKWNKLSRRSLIHPGDTLRVSAP
jgi:membrane-bound lytic murein transglycosylase D